MLQHHDGERGGRAREQGGCLKSLTLDKLGWEYVPSFSRLPFAPAKVSLLPVWWLWYKSYYLIQVCNKVLEGKNMAFFALQSSQEHWSTRTAQKNILLPGYWEHIWYASLLLRVYFQGSEKITEKTSGKIGTFQ